MSLSDHTLRKKRSLLESCPPIHYKSGQLSWLQTQGDTPLIRLWQHPQSHDQLKVQLSDFLRQAHFNETLTKSLKNHLPTAIHTLEKAVAWAEIVLAYNLKTLALPKFGCFALFGRGNAGTSSFLIKWASQIQAQHPQQSISIFRFGAEDTLLASQAITHQLHVDTTSHAPSLLRWVNELSPTSLCLIDVEDVHSLNALRFIKTKMVEVINSTHTMDTALACPTPPWWVLSHLDQTQALGHWLSLAIESQTPIFGNTPANATNVPSALHTTAEYLIQTALYPKQSGCYSK